MDNKDLVKALRVCLGDYTEPENCMNECPFSSGEDCEFDKGSVELLYQSADAIERLEAENAALRAQPERTGNKPLTLDELREMDGKPIWTVTTGVEESGRWELCACEMVRACPLHLVLRCATAIGEATDYEFDTYGKTWIAYRHKPEQEGI